MASTPQCRWVVIVGELNLKTQCEDFIQFQLETMKFIVLSLHVGVSLHS